jgi:nucleoside-diphosphate-sugar epimerase
MACVIVTGGSGFIGTSLVATLRSRRIEAWNLDIAPPRDPAAAAWHLPVDIMDKEALERTFGRLVPESVCHLAARTDIDGKEVRDYAVNVQGTRNVLSASRCAGVRRVLLASSQLVNPIDSVPTDEFAVAPPNAYGRSKVEAEEIVRSEAGATEWVIVRPTSVWGPWFGVKYQGLFRSVRRGLYMHPAGRRITKAWGYVGNVANDIASLLEAGSAVGKTLYLADEEPYDLLDFAQEIREAWGAPPVRQVPLPVLSAIARIGDASMAMGVRFPLHSYRLRNLLTDMGIRANAVRTHCGPQAWSRRDGVAATVQWMRTNPGFSRDSSLH